MNKKSVKKILERKKSSHKGDSGHVLVIAGSLRMAGAALLASVAALRISADLVTLAAPSEVAKACNVYCPDIMTIPCDGNFLTTKHIAIILKDIKKYDSILIGNGIGRNKQTIQFVRKLIPLINHIPKVIDADALHMITLGEVNNSILTPHKKEFEILLSSTGISEKDLKKHIDNNVILLKGNPDKIITSKKSNLNKTGNPGMAKAGTGDVLAGVTAAFLAKTKDGEKSARAAAWLTGHMGDVLKKKKGGFYFLASDIVQELSRARAL